MRDLIEAGLSELADAVVVVMDLVVAGSMASISVQGQAPRIDTVSAACTPLWKVAFRTLLTDYGM